MKKEKIVQFVSFESTTTTNEFIAQWEEYNNAVIGEQEATLQQERNGKNLSRYLSQHSFDEAETQFSFKTRRRSANSHEVEMHIKQAGGYSVLQLECDHETEANECKVFVFLSKTPELQLYKELLGYQYLNIYQAYYESCTHTYILEFFVDNLHVAQLIEQLQSHNRTFEMGVYKECEKPKSKAQKRILLKS